MLLSGKFVVFPFMFAQDCNSEKPNMVLTQSAIIKFKRRSLLLATYLYCYTYLLFLLETSNMQPVYNVYKVSCNHLV